MIIRKRFSYEMSHRVIDAFTRRCSHNIHGHSYKLELLFSGSKPDDAQMVMDFGFVKKYFHPFVDAFDHAHMVWDRTDNSGISSADINHIMMNNERWIVAPFSSTAEMQAKMFLTFSTMALDELSRMELINDSVQAYSAIVHETDTGYAEYRLKDFNTCQFPSIQLNDINFSRGCMNDWSSEFKDFYNQLLKNEKPE